MRSNRETISLSWVKEILALNGLTATDTPDQYAKHDLNVSNNGIIEVKERWLDKSKFTKYSEEGFILEDIKYKYLLGKKSLYCNLFDFTDIKIALFWDINQLHNINIVDMNCKATTSFSNNNYVSKPIHLVNINQCSNIFIYKDNEWTQTDTKTVFSKIKS